jgi:flagellar biosynthesis/type III secretory pathway protein FliH
MYLTPNEIDDQEKSEFFIQDMQAIAKASRESLEKVRQEGRQEGREEGIQVGREEGKQDLLFRQLTKRFGKLSDRRQTQISALELTKLEELAEVLLDFASISDLDRWLEQF